MTTNNASNNPTVGDYNRALLAGYRSAANAITSAGLTLRLLNHTEGGNDSMSVVVAELERCRAVVAGIADGLASKAQPRTATTDSSNGKPAPAPSDKPVVVEESKPVVVEEETVPAPFTLTNVSTSALEKMSVTRYTEQALDTWCVSRGTTTPPMNVFVQSVKDELAKRKPLRGGVETSPPVPVVVNSNASKSAKEEAQIKAANPPVVAAVKPAAPVQSKVAWRLQGSESVLLYKGHALRVRALPNDKFTVIVDGVEKRTISWVSHEKGMEASRNDLYAMACDIATEYALVLKPGKATEEDIAPLAKPAAAPVAVQASKPALVASPVRDDEPADEQLDAISDEEREALADENEGIAVHLCNACDCPAPIAAKFCPECGARQDAQEDAEEEEDTPPVKAPRKPASKTSKPVTANLDSATSMAALRQQAKDLKIKGYALPTIKRETLEAKIAEAQAAQRKASKPAAPKASKPASAGVKKDSVAGRVLAFLATSKRGCTGNLIASEIGDNWPSNVTKICDQFAEGGIVEKDVEDRNGRDVFVYLITDAGRAALKSAK